MTEYELFLRHEPETAETLECWILIGRDRVGQRVEIRRLYSLAQTQAMLRDIEAGQSDEVISKDYSDA